jgi:hypothetical protein
MGLDSGKKPSRLDERIRELAGYASSMGYSAQSRGSNVHFEWESGLQLDLHTLERWLYETPSAIRDNSVLGPVPLSPTHGDLNANNILIDRHGFTWLIDFGRTGYGYRFRDFAELESVVGLDLRRHSNLNPLLRFEEILCSQTRWEDKIEAPDGRASELDDPDLLKSLRVIQELRRIARQWEKDGGTLRRYYLALLFEACLRIVTDGRDSLAQPSPLWRRAHALLRAAMLIETLAE